MDIFFSLALQSRMTKEREPVPTTESLHFVYGRQDFFTLKIFDFEKIKSDYQVVNWDVIVYDNDDSGVICHTLNQNIDSAEMEDGIISFPVVTKTKDFRDKTKNGNIHGWMEVRGLNSDDAVVLSMKFKCIAEYSNDFSDEIPEEIVADFATKQWVRSIISGGEADSFITKDMLDSALSGMKIRTQEATTFQIIDRTIVKYTLSGNEVFLFDLSSLKNEVCATMELWLTMPEEVVSFTMPDVTWIEELAFDTPNMMYAVVIRWDGEKVIGNVAYTLEVS
ncbi:MAG: hypothetical protein IJW23_10930 [Lentisphaeria bacterium]|nr:hypothetical protein [Lentisphaeria bacterium]